MTRFEKRPQVIHAVRYNGFVSFEKMRDFMGEDFENALFRPHSEDLLIGEFTAKVGDYVIRDMRHGYVPMNKDKFECLYKKVE